MNITYELDSDVVYIKFTSDERDGFGYKKEKVLEMKPQEAIDKFREFANKLDEHLTNRWWNS